MAARKLYITDRGRRATRRRRCRLVLRAWTEVTLAICCTPLLLRTCGYMCAGVLYKEDGTTTTTYDRDSANSGHSEQILNSSEARKKALPMAFWLSNSIWVLYALFSACLISICHVIEVFHKNSRHVHFARQLKGPPGLPLIGHSLDFWHGGVEGVRKLMQYGQEYGSIYRVWFGKYLYVVLSDVKDIEVVLRKADTGEKPEIFLTSFRKFLANGLSTCPANIWKVTRKRMQPLYGKKELTHFVPEINRIADKFVRDMETLCGEPEFDICERLKGITFNAITKPNLNIEFDLNELSMMEFDPNESSKLTFPSLNKVFSEIGFMRMFRSWLHIPLVYHLRYSRTEREIKKHMRAFTETVLKKNRTHLEELRKNPTPGTHEMPLLTTLYQMQNEALDEDWLRDQMAFFVAAGTDAMAVTVSFCLLSIAMNPSIQKNLLDELDDVFDDDRETTIADLDRLVYLDKVLKETERRYTFLPLIFRSVSVDREIGPYTFPAGTVIAINLNQIHHDPKYYPDPFKFDPENFSEEAVKSRPPLSFIPFSSGPKNCIGIYYAYLVMKLTLVALLRKFQFETTMTESSIKINIGFITTSNNGYKVSIKSREKRNK